VKKVDVTGGTPSGRAIGAIAGGNLASFTAELGGKAPVIVTEQADIRLAVNGAAFGAFVASGQTCIAATRFVVHTSVRSEFERDLIAKAKSIERRMGAPTNPASMMGGIISAKQLSHIRELVDDAKQGGATVATGGSIMIGLSPLDGFDFSQGHFYQPTILTSSAQVDITSLRIWREEAFGPVVVITEYKTEEQALAMANDSEFGLGAAIWTKDLSEAHRLSDGIESGICWGKAPFVPVFETSADRSVQSIRITAMIRAVLGAVLEVPESVAKTASVRRNTSSGYDRH
jgi:acyl-CoA reductase-like NAD-dependent aldehyde dehydrogenase